MKKSQVSVVDLFAGIGGLSVGASQLGAKVAASVELDPTACRTLRSNSQYHGEILEASVCAIDGVELRAAAGLRKRDPLLVVGGAPCQPFSKAAYWVEEGKDAAFRRARANGESVVRPAPPKSARPDARRDLVSEFWRLIHESSADAFVFENVPSIKHPRNKPIYDGFLREALASGFLVTEVVANAADYGVAQTRERVFILGSKRGKPMIPTPTNSSEPLSKLPRPITAREALRGLNLKKYFEPEEIVTGRWADHLRSVPPGWNYKAHTAWAGHPNPTFVTETRFWNFLLKLSPDRPSWTIAANPGPWTGPFHWLDRRLRTPELLALQGFPTEYVVEGTRRERVRQVGNAVPVPLAKQMISTVLETLE